MNGILPRYFQIARLAYLRNASRISLLPVPALLLTIREYLMILLVAGLALSTSGAANARGGQDKNSPAQEQVALPDGWSSIPRLFYYKIYELYLGPGKFIEAYKKDFPEHVKPAIYVVCEVKAEELNLKNGAGAQKQNLHTLDTTWRESGDIRNWFKFKNILQDQITMHEEDFSLEYSVEAITLKNKLFFGRTRVCVQENGDLHVYFYGAEDPSWKASLKDRETIFAALQD